MSVLRLVAAAQQSNFPRHIVTVASSPHKAEDRVRIPMAQMKPTDLYLEYTLIPDGTAQEMAQAFVDMANAKYAENRLGMSKTFEKMVDFEAIDCWKAEFKGAVFLIVQWAAVRKQTEEEFFGAPNEDEIDGEFKVGG